VFKNRVLRRIFGPKRDEVTGDWRKLHNEELRFFLFIGAMVVVNWTLLIIAEKNGVGVTAVADMKTPSARKQASRRSTANSGQKPTPLRGE
jgi:hypothetical protein